MPHRKSVRRAHEPGDCHESTSSCDRRLPLLADAVWRRPLAESIDRATPGRGFDPVAFVFVPEHVHLSVLPTRPEVRIDRLPKAINRAAVLDAHRAGARRGPRPVAGGVDGPGAAGPRTVPLPAGGGRRRSGPPDGGGRPGGHRVHPPQPRATRLVRSGDRVEVVRRGSFSRGGRRRRSGSATDFGPACGVHHGAWAMTGEHWWTSHQ